MKSLVLSYTGPVDAQVEMMDYIAEIQQWAAEYLSINIPDPGEQMEIF